MPNKMKYIWQNQIKRGEIMKTCFFIGHRDAPESAASALRAAVERHIIEYGVTAFVVGHYGNFDRLAAAAVIAAKAAYPHITLTLLLPYHPAVQPIDVPRGFDDSCYPTGLEGVPRHVAIPQANRYAVEHADYLIAYSRYAASNARRIVNYAQRRGIPVYNLAHESPR